MFDPEEHLHELAANIIQKTGDNTELKDIQSCAGGNNKGWVIRTEERIYFLKHYFFSKEDTRDRLGTEAAFAEFAGSSGIKNIPELLVLDKKNLLGLFQFIEGEKPTSRDMNLNYVKQAGSFIVKLNGDNKHSSVNCLSLASDACLSIKEHLTSLENRFPLFQGTFQTDSVDLKANDFIWQSLYPEWKKLKSLIEKKTMQWEMDEEQRLDRAQRIISPSDFGFHNSILSKGTLYFIDFEYAGWDDPAKMVCDFFCQPEIPVSLKYFEYFVKTLSGLLRDQEQSKGLDQRIKLLFPLYRLKWCCIMLNDFTLAAGKRKRFASSGQDRRQKQLEKTAAYYQAFDANHWYRFASIIN